MHSVPSPSPPSLILSRSSLIFCSQLILIKQIFQVSDFFFLSSSISLSGEVVSGSFPPIPFLIQQKAPRLIPASDDKAWLSKTARCCASKILKTEFTTLYLQPPLSPEPLLCLLRTPKLDPSLLPEFIRPLLLGSLPFLLRMDRRDINLDSLPPALLAFRPSNTLTFRLPPLAGQRRSHLLDYSAYWGIKAVQHF